MTRAPKQAKRGAPKKQRKRPPAQDPPPELLLSDSEPPSKPKTAARQKAGSSSRASKGPVARKGIQTRTIVGISAVLLALVIGVFAAFVFLPGPGNGKPVEVEVAGPPTSGGITTKLAEAKLLRSAFVFRVFAAFAGVDTIKPGIHLLTDDMSPRTLLRRLRRTPGGATVRVVFPEGYNKFDIAKRLHESGVCSSRAFLAATTDAHLLLELHLGVSDAEGYLFPATYEFLRNTDPRDVVRRLALEAERRYARLFEQHAAGMADLKATLGFAKHEVLILASIVEKEAVVDEERPLIASVFLNRLRDSSVKPERRKLQSDPTARYGCLLFHFPTCAPPESKPTSIMVHDPSNPYSTYAHPGLTPGPIANPSERSVQAVLAPAQTRYQFFVAKGNGRHTFSETLEEHNAAVHGRH